MIQVIAVNLMIIILVICLAMMVLSFYEDIRRKRLTVPSVIMYVVIVLACIVITMNIILFIRDNFF